MAWLILLLPIPLLMHVTVRAHIVHSGTTKARVVWKFACLTKTWQSDQQPRPHPAHRYKQLLLRGFRHSDAAKHLLRKHLHLERLDALILLHAGDAALTALLAGGLQGIASIPTHQRKAVNIRVLPDFYHGQSTVQARCIIRIRMGTILLTMLLLLAQCLQQKARTAHGTSHW